MSREYEQIVWDEALRDDLTHLVRLAIREDLERGQDWTTVSLVPSHAEGAAYVVARQAGVICGLLAIDTLFQLARCDARFQLLATDGDSVTTGQHVARLEGSVRDLLTTERILLNLIGRLSGIATRTREFVGQLPEDSGCRLYDTRKTTPGWRRLEKYAVRCGGGYNHRRGLDSAILIKDNHLAWARQQFASGQGSGSDLAHVVDYVRKRMREAAATLPVTADLLIEVEVDSLEQLQSVLPAQPDIVLLDNMSPDQLRRAVAIRDETRSLTQLEASGGIRLETVAEVARTGVERISVGALTHSATALDVALDWA